MRVITWRRLREFAADHPDAEDELSRWYDIVDSVSWRHPVDVKSSFGHRVDFVQVRSGTTVAVFDVCNNRYRLIAAVHYDHPRVFVLRILTHAEYDKNRWKDEL